MNFYDPQDRFIDHRVVERAACFNQLQQRLSLGAVRPPHDPYQFVELARAFLGREMLA